MNMSSENPSAGDSNPVEVVITVTQFNDVFAGGGPDGAGTGYAMQLRKPDPRAEIKDDDIYVKRPGAVLRFTIASAETDRNRYYPVGIAFVREGNDSTSDEHRLGILNFPPLHMRVDGRTLLISDRYHAETRRVRHKFSVLIQRGSDGKIGVIDPGIIHEND